MLVIGPGGMGKTRLTAEARAAAAGSDRSRAAARGMQRNVSLHPFRGLLERCVRDGRRRSTADVRLAKLRSALSAWPARPTRRLGRPALPAPRVFDIPLDRLSAPSEVQPDRLRRLALLAAAAAGPRPRHAPSRRWSSSTTCSGPTSRALDLLAVLLTLPGL